MHSHDVCYLSGTRIIPGSKVLGANSGPTWVLSALDGPHAVPMNLDIRVVLSMAEKWMSKKWMSGLWTQDMSDERLVIGLPQASLES